MKNTKQHRMSMEKAKNVVKNSIQYGLYFMLRSSLDQNSSEDPKANTYMIHVYSISSIQRL